jgi:hypothetical protein
MTARGAGLMVHPHSYLSPRGRDGYGHWREHGAGENLSPHASGMRSLFCQRERVKWALIRARSFAALRMRVFPPRADAAEVLSL